MTTLIRTALLAATLAGMSALDAGTLPQAETLAAVPSFGAVTVYRPAGLPKQVVLFISGDGGWNLGVVGMANRLREAGALVAGIDIRAFRRSLEASSDCAYPAGALEELSRALQLRYRLPAYQRPVLVGYSSGATLVYAALAAAPPETFAGAISLGFCPDIELRTPLCQMRGLRAAKRPRGVGFDLSPFPASTVPWMVLQGEVDQVCDPEATRTFAGRTGATRVFSLPGVGHGFGVEARWVPQFMAAYREIGERRATREGAPAIPAPVADLSLVEVDARAAPGDDRLAIVLTGDGGWADIDRSIAGGLAAAGVPVVGWSSLGYYWTPRTPETAARDLERIIDHYASSWQKARVVVVGYSFGADVAPFLVNRLSEPARRRVAGVVLLGASENAAFEFHLASWLGGGGEARYPTVPEIERLPVPVTCVSGADEPESVCGRLTGALVRSASVGRGHHFGGDYARVVQLILAGSGKPGQ